MGRTGWGVGGGGGGGGPECDGFQKGGRAFGEPVWPSGKAVDW